MAKHLTKNEKQEITELYKNGETLSNIAQRYNKSRSTIYQLLCSQEVYTKNTKKTYNISDEDKIFIHTHFPDYNIILEKFKGYTRENIFNIIKQHNIKCKQVTWSQLDKDIVRKNMYNKTWLEIAELLHYERTINSIAKTAKNLGYTNNTLWSEEEVKILEKYYHEKSPRDMCKILPNRKIDSIIVKAKKLGLHNINDQRWSESEKEYIIQNWILIPDVLIAEKLNRTKRSVKWMRGTLGLYRMEKGQKNYSRLGDFLRRNTTQWKKDSMEKCNFKCVISGGKNFQVHHISPVNVIIKDILEHLNINEKSFNKYSESELANILSAFKEKQNKQYGVCIDKDIHTLFHKMYGYDTTAQQLSQFIQDYKNGIYEKLKID